MLLPVDLMSIVSAGVSPANARDPDTAAAGTPGSWLLAADSDTSSSSAKDMIDKLFMSYTNDGKGDQGARFAADLKSLLSAHGVSFTSDPAWLSQTQDLPTALQSVPLGDLDWSVDELLQMSMGPLAGGNSLPPGDQSLPADLGHWLAALMAPAGETDAATASRLLPGSGGDRTDVDPVAAVLTAGKAMASGTTGDALLQVPGAGVNDRSAGFAASTTAVGTAEIQTDSQTLAPNATARIWAAGGAGQDVTVRPLSPADVTSQASEAAQLNPGSQKITSDTVNASAFRSIQFNQPGTSNSGALAADPTSATQSDLNRPGAPLERNQAIASQLTSSVTTGVTTETSASGNPAQLFNPADGSAVMNRAEQRMFATESAQQAQSQAAQQTATRSAESLPRFAMDTAFGQQGWSDSLGRQLLVMSSQGVTSAQIRLDPPELGSLTVKIQMSADQQTSVSFVSQHAQVREALEQQLNRLQDLFRDQGLDLQDVSVSDQSPQDRDDGTGEHRGRGSNRGDSEQDIAEAEPVLVRSESLIDFYA